MNTTVIQTLTLAVLLAVNIAPYGLLSDHERFERLSELRAIPALADRAYAIFQWFLETPYAMGDPLGECGDGEDCRQYRDPDTRYGLTEEFRGIGENCVTLRDKVLALAIASDPELEPLRKRQNLNILNLAKRLMDDIRYQPNRPISYDTRNHYEIKDFLRAHQGRYVEDITDDLGAPTYIMRGYCKPQELLGAAAPAQWVQTTYIPMDALPEILAKIPHSAIIYCMKPTSYGPLEANGDPVRGHVLVAHVGFCFRDGQQVYFGHASSKQGKVVLEDFREYFARQKSLWGIKVLRLRMPTVIEIERLLTQ